METQKQGEISAAEEGVGSQARVLGKEERNLQNQEGSIHSGARVTQERKASVFMHSGNLSLVEKTID